jgi:hypothetical protein
MLFLCRDVAETRLHILPSITVLCLLLMVGHVQARPGLSPAVIGLLPSVSHVSHQQAQNSNQHPAQPNNQTLSILDSFHLSLSPSVASLPHSKPSGTKGKPSRPQGGLPRGLRKAHTFSHKPTLQPTKVPNPDLAEMRSSSEAEQPRLSWGN